MKKVMIVLLTILILSTAYFGYQTMTLKREIDQKVETLIKKDESSFSTMVTENADATSLENSISKADDKPAVDNKNEVIDYGTALSRVETFDQLIDLFRFDLSETQLLAFGYKTYDFYKSLGSEEFVVTLASREDIVLQEEIIKALIGELKLVKKMDTTMDLQVYIDDLVTFINEGSPTTNELRVAYDLRWAMDDLKRGRLNE